MKVKEQILVDGMTCSNCSNTVTKRLEKLGLENVSTDYLSGEVSFNNTQEIDFEIISAEIKKIGYQVKINDKETSRKLSAPSIRFYFSLAFTVPLMLHMVLPHEHPLNNAWLQFWICLPVFILGAFHFGKSGWYSVLSGAANMDVLIFIGSTAAFAYSLYGTLLFYPSHEVHNYLFFETTSSIITLVFLGNLIEHRSINQTTDALKSLKKLQQSAARKIITTSNGEEIIEISNEDILIDDILLINKGDRIPTDAVIVSGEAYIDESLLTGESIPIRKSINDVVIGGTVLLEGNLRIKVNKKHHETVLASIIDLVKNAGMSKPTIQKLGDKVSAIFVPIVIVIALLTFLVSYFAFDIIFREAMIRAVAVLVISCPCAMGLATPTAIVAGLGRAAKSGILIKGGTTIEELAKIKKIVFDKTGTLTTGQFKIQHIELFQNMNLKELKNIVYSLELHSNHPIAKSICSELKEESVKIEFANFDEKTGLGLQALDHNGDKWQLGSHKLINDDQLFRENSVYLLKNDALVGIIQIQDEIKKSAFGLSASLKDKGIETIMLSGDKKSNVEKVASQLKITTIYSEKTPEEKLKIIEALNAESLTAMVGDGVNDSPALSKAHLGISFGNSSDIAINSADVVLLSDDLDKIKVALLIGKHTLLTIKQNLFWAFFYNSVAIPIAAIGLLNPIIAAGAMAFSDLIVVGNSIRLKYKNLR